MQQLKLWWQDFLDNQFNPRYQALEQREQRLLSLTAVFVAVMVLVFVIILPIQDQRQEMQVYTSEMFKQASEAAHLAELLKQGGKAKTSTNLMADVDRLAREKKVRQFMKRIRPQPGADGKKTLLIQMKDAPYASVVSFMSALTEYGLSMPQVKLQAADSAGSVHVQMTISGV